MEVSSKCKGLTRQRDNITVNGQDAAVVTDVKTFYCRKFVR